MTVEPGKCTRCGCNLSAYRADPDRLCHPCYTVLADISYRRAATIEQNSNSARAFVMRWEGFLWREIAAELGYVKITTAHNQARHFAMKRGLILPQHEEQT